MNSFSLERFLFVSLTTLVVGAYSISRTKTRSIRIVLTAFLIGFYVYSGVGFSDRSVPFEYFWYFAIFLCCFAFFYLVSAKDRDASRSSDFDSSLKSMFSPTFSRRIILAYYVVTFFSVMYPDFDFGRLIHPGGPDLGASLASRFTEVPNEGFVSSILRYLTLLLFPLFLISLNDAVVPRPFVFLLLFLDVYLSYTESSYVGRSTVLMRLIMLGIVYLVLNPKPKKRYYLLIILLTPLLSMAFYQYQYARWGLSAPDVAWYHALRDLLEVETSFPLHADTFLGSGFRADLKGYLVWLVTLPIPKVLTGEISGARINYEISEILGGVARTAPSFRIYLVGLVTESVYIYGPYLFPIHAATLGIVVGSVTKLMGRSPRFGFLFAYFSVLVGYNLNRAGIAGFISVITNSFIAVYVISLALSRGTGRSRYAESQRQTAACRSESRSRSSLTDSSFSRTVVVGPHSPVLPRKNKSSWQPMPAEERETPQTELGWSTPVR